MQSWNQSRQIIRSLSFHDLLPLDRLLFLKFPQTLEQHHNLRTKHSKQESLNSIPDSNRASSKLSISDGDRQYSQSRHHLPLNQDLSHCRYHYIIPRFLHLYFSSCLRRFTHSNTFPGCGGNYPILYNIYKSSFQVNILFQFIQIEPCHCQNSLHHVLSGNVNYSQ